MKIRTKSAALGLAVAGMVSLVAHADDGMSGMHQMNGMQMNGMQMQGMEMNGMSGMGEMAGAASGHGSPAEAAQQSREGAPAAAARGNGIGGRMGDSAANRIDHQQR